MSPLKWQSYEKGRDQNSGHKNWRRRKWLRSEDGCWRETQGSVGDAGAGQCGGEGHM